MSTINYTNFNASIYEVTDEALIRLRKDNERNLIFEFENAKQESCKEWYVISMNWIKKWKNYVNG